MASKKQLLKKAQDIKAEIYYLQTNGGDDIDSYALIRAYDAICAFTNQLKDNQ